MQDNEGFSRGLEEPRQSSGDGPSPWHVVAVIGMVLAMALLALQCGCGGAPAYTLTEGQAMCAELYAGADTAEDIAAADRVCPDGGAP